MKYGPKPRPWIKFLALGVFLLPLPKNATSSATKPQIIREQYTLWPESRIYVQQASLRRRRSLLPCNKLQKLQLGWVCFETNFLVPLAISLSLQSLRRWWWAAVSAINRQYMIILLSSSINIKANIWHNVCFILCIMNIKRVRMWYDLYSRETQWQRPAETTRISAFPFQHSSHFVWNFFLCTLQRIKSEHKKSLFIHFTSFFWGWQKHKKAFSPTDRCAWSLSH